MPLQNDYNEKIAKQVHDTLSRKVEHEKAVHGGNGFAMATHLDLGVGAPSLGIRSTFNKNDTGYKIGGGTSGGGASGGGLSGGDWTHVIDGVGHVAAAIAPLLLAAGKPPQKKGGARKKNMAGGNFSLGGTELVQGDAPITQPIPQTAPQADPPKEATIGATNADLPSKIGGKRPNKRAQLVKQIMQEKGMKLIEASKYVKQHNLYKP
jgi:hypothetical protein